MGGAKCSYKNCTVRSDRKTHMFHYPVLDRPRCHQWLINSNRYDYLSLTVSQLKNRRICQHHFTLDSFMNETMTKLKSSAIPTVDGPYCDLENLPDNDHKMESFDSVVFEDIENLKYPRKYLEKDTFSKRYSSFLTDGDMVDEDTLKDSVVETNLILNTTDTLSLPISYKPKRNSITSKSILQKPIKRKETEIKPKTKATNKLEQYKPSRADTLNAKAMNINAMSHKSEILQKPIKGKEFEIKLETKTTSDDQYKPSTADTVNTKPININELSCKSDIRATKIQIISEETITDPVPVVGTLKPVKPNTILSLPNRKYNKIQEPNKNMESNYTLSIDDKLNITIQENNNSNALKSPKPMNVEQEKKMVEIEIPVFDRTVDNLQNTSLDVGSVIDLNHSIKRSNLSFSKPNKSFSKVNTVQDSNTTQSLSLFQDGPQPVSLVKITQDRATAIQKKRNFNKRLRDMISFQMDLSNLSPTKPSYVSDITNNHDAQNKTININTSQYGDANVKQSIINNSALSLSTPTTTRKKPTNIQVKSHLSEDKSLPNIQSYNTLIAIEARMKHMEELMLTKIEHNTQTIVNLKKSVEEKFVKQYNTVSTQTDSDELSHKKYLYREISKYLTTDANSLIYEELFINKHVSGVTKRRKIS